MLPALVVFAALAGPLQADELPPGEAALPLVEQSVDCISVAHLPDGIDLVFFWGLVQGEWACLDHRWVSSGMIVTRDQGEWLLQWPDDAEGCYRLVRTACWVESWEAENPLAAQNRGPWFVQLLAPGLKQPRRK